MKDFLSKYILVIGLIFFGLAGFALIWLSTPWGIGVGYDSIFYLSAADNLLSGQGLSRLDGYGNVIPLTHFPPLYSLLLAGLSFITGFSTDLAARILAAIFFGLLVAISGWLLYRYTHKLSAAFLGAFMVLVSPVLLDISFMAMSELPFLIFQLLFIHFLNLYLLKGKLKDMVISAVLAAMMYLTRYVGLVAIALAGFSLLFLQARSWMGKVKDVILFLVISLVPILIFYARNWSLTGSFSNRIISFHPPTVNQIKQGVNTISIWLLPAGINSSERMVILGIFLIAFVIIILAYLLRGGNNEANQEQKIEGKKFVTLMLAYAIIYLFLVTISLTLFDASTKLNDRILSPVLLSALLAGLIAAFNIEWFEANRVFRYSIIILCLVFISINILRGFDIANSMRIGGRGFSGREWRTSETIEGVSQLPADTLMFSNEAFAIYYLTGNSANWIPENYDPVKDQEDENYSQHINFMRDEIISQNGVLVIFNSIAKHNIYAPIEELTNGLSLLAKYPDGALYASP